jgi:hypothetical protein
MTYNETVEAIMKKATSEPQFAIAFAVLALTEQVKEMRVGLTGSILGAGVLQDIALALSNIAQGAESVATSISTIDFSPG